MIGDRLLQGAAELRAMTSTLRAPSSELLEAFGARKTHAGVTVDWESSLSLSAVSACVSRISTAVAALPCIVYEKSGERTRKRADTDPMAARLRVSPNPEQTAMEFFEVLLGFMLLWPSAYVYLERRPGPGAPALWPLRPDRVDPVYFLDGPMRNRLKGYEVRVGDDPQEVVEVDARDMIPLREHGYTAKSIVDTHRETIGLGLASQEFGSRFFSQGASMSGWVQVPSGTKPEEVDRLEAKLRAKHEGLTRSHLIGMLVGGAEWKEVGMPLRDAQYIEGQKFTVEQVARMFGVPPHKIGHLERATFSNIEQQNIEWVVDRIGPTCTRVEQALRMFIFPPRTRRGYMQVGDRYPEFLLDGLLRGDHESRNRAYAVAVQNGWMSRAEVRERENLPEGDDYLDEFLTPANYIVGDPADQPAPDPAAAPGDGEADPEEDPPEDPADEPAPTPAAGGGDATPSDDGNGNGSRSRDRALAQLLARGQSVGG